MASVSPALSIKGLSKSYGRCRAVDGLSLDVAEGEMVGFLGPNGAGKTTTLTMVAGLVRPDTGSIEVYGCDVRRHFVQAMGHVGSMVQEPAFHGHLSGLRNLLFLARLRASATSRAAEIEEILKLVNLYDRRRDKVRGYSHGMKQRLGLAAALLGKPRLLLLDEPTNGMDPEAMHEILTLIRAKVQDEGLAVFISSHLLAEVEEYCDRVVVIDRGRLVCTQTVADIVTAHEGVIRVAFGEPVPTEDVLGRLDGVARVARVAGNAFEVTLTGRDSAWLNETLVGKGLRVASLVPKQKSLKEFFLSTTGDGAYAAANAAAAEE